MHSNFSDGSDSPTELVQMAAAAGLEAMSLTDHDTTAGLAEARAAALLHDIELVDGVELSARLPSGKAVHVLGYFIDPTAASMLEHARQLAAERRRRAAGIVERLTSLGVCVDEAAIESCADGAPTGRPHIAQALVRSGAATSIKQVFRRWLHDGGPADVPLVAPSAVTVVARVREAGGVSVLAHPSSSRVAREEVVELRAAGLGGIESRHAEQSPSEVERWSIVAGELGLAESGGSDHHGSRGRRKLGSVRVPYAWVENLRTRRPL